MYRSGRLKQPGKLKPPQNEPVPLNVQSPSYHILVCKDSQSKVLRRNRIGLCPTIVATGRIGIVCARLPRHGLSRH